MCERAGVKKPEIRNRQTGPAKPRDATGASAGPQLRIAAANPTGRLWTSLTEALQIPCSILIPCGASLIHGVTNSWMYGLMGAPNPLTQAAHPALKSGATPMRIDFDAETLWLIPLGIALWFLVWVLWRWWLESRR